MRKWRVIVFSSLFVTIVGISPSAAELRHIPWRELPQRVDGRLIALEELGVTECPKDLALRQPSRKVLQVIENTFYSWEEYDLSAVPTASYCVVMRQPYDQVLSRVEAQVLLSASSLWLERASVPSESRVLSPDDLSISQPLRWRGDPTIDLTPDRQPDQGFVGWANLHDRGQPEERAEPRGRAGLGSGLRPLTDGTVIGGKDERTLVTNTAVFPHRLISFLTFDSGSGPNQRSRATGFLVSPHMILTNGHVIWDDERQQLSRNLEVSPGQHQGAGGVTQPFGIRTAVRLATNPGWVATQKIHFDYGAAFFETPFPNVTTYMPLAFDVVPPTGSTVHVAGYPASVNNKASNTQWHHSDKVVSVQGRLVRYRVDTTPGNSGSPVWQILPGGQVRAIAVHSSGDTTNSGNSGARLVTQNFELISEWMRWSPQTRTGLRLTINQVDPQSCPLVKAIVSVVGAAGQPLPDLTRANFSLNENGFPQDIDVEQAEVSDSAISLALVLDASGSLSDADVENVRVASRRFVDLLGPRDKVAVYHFANGVVLVQDYSSDKLRVKAAINALHNGGGGVGDGSATALLDAIIEAAQHSNQATGRRALVAMTDGQNNTGTLDPQLAVNAAQNAAVPVFTIGFGDVDPFVLNDIAVLTGGRFFYGATSGDLQTILTAIGRTLEKQYLLTWVSSFISGGTQRVDVAVVDGLDSDEKSTTYSQAGTTGCPLPNATCDAQIVTPNGGEVWSKGRRHTLEWTTTGPSCGETVGLAISNGSEIWYLLDTQDDGSQPLNIDFLPAGPLYRAIVADRATGQSGRSSETFTISAASGFTCAKGAQTLCLLQGRYQVRVLWRLPQGGGNFAGAVPLGDSTGYFWFLDKNNPELAVKLVDGRVTNAHVWFRSGALTSFEYSIFVTDSKSGESRVYSSVSGEFRSFADDTAFGPPAETAHARAPILPDREPISAAIRTAPAPAVQKVLWNQMDHLGDIVISSENRLDAGATALSTEGADDFVVPANKVWVLEGIDVVGAYYGEGGPNGPAESVNVFVYADRGGFPGSVSCTQRQLRPRRGISNGSFEVDLETSCRLPTGRYWIAVQANQDVAKAGQWGWLERTTQRERSSAWRNPGGGYGTACSDWATRSRCAGHNPDFTFRLRGQESSGGGESCKPTSEVLCLNGNRIKVEVTWHDAKGKPTAAKVQALGDRSGYFSFGGKSLDLLVKVIDGRSINGKFWVFYGGLSSAEFTLRAIDMKTGNFRSYTNPKGRYTSSGDIDALPAF